MVACWYHTPIYFSRSTNGTVYGTFGSYFCNPYLAQLHFAATELAIKAKTVRLTKKKDFAILKNFKINVKTNRFFDL